MNWISVKERLPEDFKRCLSFNYNTLDAPSRSAGGGVMQFGCAHVQAQMLIYGGCNYCKQCKML
jgi:hypothetical protein